MRPVVQHDPARPQLAVPSLGFVPPQLNVSAIIRRRNQPSHRQFEGSHDAVAARIKSAAQDPIPHAGKAVRHRSVVVRRD